MLQAYILQLIYNNLTASASHGALTLSHACSGLNLVYILHGDKGNMMCFVKMMYLCQTKCSGAIL